MRKSILSLLVSILLIASSTLSYADSHMQTNTTAQCTKAEVNLKMDMRKLWEDHIAYTRNYIISAIAQLEDLDAVTARLLKNQDEIGAAIKPYYGDAASTKLTALLREHIVLAGDVVKAAIKNDTAAVKAAQDKWTVNADEISTFLSSANPNWKQDDLKNMMYKHLELTTGEATSRLKKDWNADIGFYDKNHTHMLMFSDALSDGIIKQFPDKFK